MSINSMIRGLKASNAQEIEMQALLHRHYILFAIKEFFINGCSFNGISEADQRREQEIKDELSTAILNIIGRFKIDSTIEFEQVNEVYVNKKEKFTVNIERNFNNEYYLVIHTNNDHVEALIKVDNEFMNKCYEFLESPLFCKNNIISEAIQAEKHFIHFQTEMNKTIENIRLKNPSVVIDGDPNLFTNINSMFLQYEEEYGYFFRDFIINLIEKEKQQILEKNAIPV